MPLPLPAFLSSPRRAPVILGVAAAVAIAGVCVAYLWSEHGRRREEQGQKLLAIADLRGREVERWRTLRETHAAAIAASPLVADGLARLAEAPEDPHARALLAALLETTIEAEGFRNAVIATTSGQVITSARPAPDRLEGPALELVAAVASEQRVAVAEPALVDGRVQLLTAVPLHDGAGRPRGAVLLEERAEDELFPMLQTWPLPSTSGEVYAVRRQGEAALLVSGVRDLPNSAMTAQPFSRQNARLPGVQAVRGREGLVQARDYRGSEVLAALRPVAGSDWALVAKIDLLEIDAPFRELAMQLGLVASALIAAVAGAVALTLRRRAAEVRALEAEWGRMRERDHHAALLASVSDAVIATDRELRVTAWNRAAERIYGWRAEEAVGRRVAEVTRPDEGGPEASELSTTSTQLLEVRHHRRDGTPIDVEMTLVATRDAAGAITGHVGVSRDITAWKKAMDAVRASEAQFRLLATRMPAGVLQVDLEGKCTWANDELCALLGMTPEEVRGDGWMRAVHPEDRERIRREWQAMSGSDVILREEIRWIAGDRVRWVYAAGMLLRDGAGAPRSVLGVLTDITELKELQAQLSRSERLASLGTLAAGMAHEMNSPLACVLSNASFALEELRGAGPELAEAREAIGEVVAAGRRAADVVKNLQTFSRSGSPLPRDGESATRRLAAELGGALAPAPEMPQPTPSPAEERRDERVEPAGSGRARILVVDDEPLVLRAVDRILATEHEVVATTDPRLALARIRAGERFDLVLCDLMMPGLTGMDLHGEVERSRPELARRMVFLTGGAFTDRAREFLQDPWHPQLQKPFDPSTLREVVAERVRHARGDAATPAP